MAEPLIKVRVLGTAGYTLEAGTFVGFGLSQLDGLLADTVDTIMFAGPNIYNADGNPTGLCGGISVTLSNGVVGKSNFNVLCNHIKPTNYPCLAYYY